MKPTDNISNGGITALLKMVIDKSLNLIIIDVAKAAHVHLERDVYLGIANKTLKYAADDLSNVRVSCTLQRATRPNPGYLEAVKRKDPDIASLPALFADRVASITLTINTARLSNINVQFEVNVGDSKKSFILTSVKTKYDAWLGTLCFEDALNILATVKAADIFKTLTAEHVVDKAIVAAP